MEVVPLNGVPHTGVIRATTTSVTTTEASKKLAKSMEDMSLQGQEIKILQDAINNLQKLKATFQSSYNTELHTTQRLKQEL